MLVNSCCVCETQGQGLSKAMTAQEARAFVGDELCAVTVLHDDKLFLEAPSTPPKARSRRQRRDTSSETLDLVVSSGFHSSVHAFTLFFGGVLFLSSLSPSVFFSSSSSRSQIKFGHGEWKVGTVRYEKKTEVPLYIIIPAVILPMLLFIAVSVYCYR